MTKEQFLDECRFAKLVTTAHGPAMLIGSMVFDVIPSERFTAGGAEPELYTEWLVSALRSATRTNDPMMSQGMTGTAA